MLFFLNLILLSLLCRGGDAHGHDNHMPEHNGHLFGEEVRNVSSSIVEASFMRTHYCTSSARQASQKRRVGENLCCRVWYWCVEFAFGYFPTFLTKQNFEFPAAALILGVGLNVKPSTKRKEPEH